MSPPPPPAIAPIAAPLPPPARAPIAAPTPAVPPIISAECSLERPFDGARLTSFRSTKPSDPESRFSAYPSGTLRPRLAGLTGSLLDGAVTAETGAADLLDEASRSQPTVSTQDRASIVAPHVVSCNQKHLSYYIGTLRNFCISLSYGRLRQLYRHRLQL